MSKNVTAGNSPASNTARREVVAEGVRQSLERLRSESIKPSWFRYKIDFRLEIDGVDSERFVGRDDGSDIFHDEPAEHPLDVCEYCVERQ